MGEELHKYKIYITTLFTTIASFAFSFSDKKFPEYLFAPISLLLTLGLCRLASSHQLAKEKREAKDISNDILDKATKVQAIINASQSKQEQDEHFEKSKRALDDILASHMADIQKQYNDKKETIKRLESHKTQLNNEIFDAVKEIDEQISSQKT